MDLVLLNELEIADVTIEITLRSKGMMVGTVVVPLVIQDKDVLFLV